MSLFEQVKQGIPTNEQLGRMVADELFADKSPGEIKANFSYYVNEMQNRIYKKYQEAEKEAGQRVIDSVIRTTGTVDFQEMNELMMSLSQSRRSRAGKAFEAIFSVLFYRLGYPYSDQVDIDGAKPDFVMPSEEHFRRSPLDSIIFTAKRTLRERWRQVVTEANKGYGFFLATFDDKITANQIQQAANHKIYIVVTDTLKQEKSHYQDAPNVLTFEDFLRFHLDPAMERWGEAVLRSL